MSITALFILGKIGNNSNTHQHENKNYNVMLVINRINDWSTWMNFKDMMLSKRSQTQKNIYDVYFHESVRNRQSSSVSVKIRTVRVVTDWKGVKENFRVMWIYYILTESSEKHLFLLYWLCQSLWLCGSQETVENSERDGNTRPPDLPLEKSVCRSGSNS